MTPFTILRYGLSGLMLTACLAITHPALAEMISFKAELKGSNEVPPNKSKGTGTLTATYDTASKKFTWKGEYSGLTGPATMAHFHGPADPTWQISTEPNPHSYPATPMIPTAFACLTACSPETRFSSAALAAPISKMAIRVSNTTLSFAACLSFRMRR